ncbi:MAG: class I SAM-dependent methyltransferase [Bacteroidetes bacterium]|nr:class I SAM-dependent methyltransferase [Bacteroidota bacterium]
MKFYGKEKLKAYYLRAQYRPRIIDCIINPFFIIRRGLFVSFRKKAPLLKGKLLDFGCGRRPYESIFTNAESYTGVDIHHNDTNFDKYVNADVFYDKQTLPFESESFDHCFSSEVIYLIEKPDEIISELHRVVKKNGLLLISAPFVWDENWTQYDFCRYTSGGLRKILERNSFEILEEEKTPSHFATIWQCFLSFIYENPFTKFKAFRLLFSIIIIAPLNILGIIINLVVPNKKNKQTFYHNIVILARAL